MVIVVISKVQMMHAIGPSSGKMSLMRLLGALMAVAGLYGSVWGLWATYHRRPPIDRLGSALLPVGVVVMILGGILLFVPCFFSGR